MRNNTRGVDVMTVCGLVCIDFDGYTPLAKGSLTNGVVVVVACACLRTYITLKRSVERSRPRQIAHQIDA